MYLLKKSPVFLLLLYLTVIPQSAFSEEKDEVLVTVEGYPITSFDISSVIVSSPMADRFPTMDEKEQAGLRGDILMRLINMNLLYQESIALGLENDPEYRQELDQYIKGYIFNHYMNKLRANIEVPQQDLDEMVKRLKGNTNALEAAISQYKAQQYKLVKSLALTRIRDQLHLQLFNERIKEGITDDTIIAKADDYVLKYKDLNLPSEIKNNLVISEIEKALYRKLEVDLVTKVAKESTPVDNIVKSFARERLPALLLHKKEKQWIPDEDTARAYFKQHPKIGYEPEQRYISQIVFSNRKQAEKILKEIKNGASFHIMAKKYSIDTVGRKNAGQLGWVTENSGPPEIEAAIKNLKDGEVSNVIKTTIGYHIVLIEGRKKGIQRHYAEIYDQVNQAIIQSKLPAYIQTLRKKYSIEFAEPVAQKYIEAE